MFDALRIIIIHMRIPADVSIRTLGKDLPASLVEHFRRLSRMGRHSEYQSLLDFCSSTFNWFVVLSLLGRFFNMLHNWIRMYQLNSIVTNLWRWLMHAEICYFQHSYLLVSTCPETWAPALHKQRVLDISLAACTHIKRRKCSCECCSDATSYMAA